MDIETVRTILAELDLDGYHQATRQKPPADDVWPTSLEDTFIEAVQIFAPVGQKKYQVVEKHNGGSTNELIGRNDIISRFIYMKTRQYRARKQVSSHIQVWAHCKKPPSSREMPMSEFEQLQVMFRHFYSRTASDPKPSKKRVRRVVSTSIVPVSCSAPPRYSLGIHSETPSISATSTTTTDMRKRSYPWTESSPTKRCRRVVSELPSLSFGPFRDHSDELSDVSTLEASALQFHCNSGLHGLAFDMNTAENTPLASEQMFLHSTSIPTHSGIFASPLDVAMRSGLSAYDLGIAAPADGSVAAFTAASIAELVRLDGGVACPDVASKERMAGIAALAPNSLFAQLPKSVMSADAISAFATAVGAMGGAGYPEQTISGDFTSIPICPQHVGDAVVGACGNDEHSEIMLDHYAPRPSEGDIYAPQLSPALWSRPEKSAIATNKHRLAEMDSLLNTGCSGVVSVDATAASAGLSMEDFCKTIKVCGEELPQTKAIADKNANNSQPASTDEPASSVGDLDVASDARSFSSPCRPNTRTEAAGEYAEPLVDTDLDSGTATEWMERFGSLVSAQYCDPSVLTAKSCNTSPQPSNSSHNSLDGDSRGADWYEMFSQYLHSIS
ncbi:hypothetical protein H4R24_002733 [Coemansia sp. RSA 988]|nr:hypothetical protein H4R24_002733 [Coemansia sp. RSA 988]